MQVTGIWAKNYDAALRRDGMKEILGYGVAFYKKNCKIVLDEQKRMKMEQGIRKNIVRVDWRNGEERKRSNESVKT